MRRSVGGHGDGVACLVGDSIYFGSEEFLVFFGGDNLGVGHNLLSDRRFGRAAFLGDAAAAEEPGHGGDDDDDDDPGPDAGRA